MILLPARFFFFWKMGTATDGMRVRAGKPGNVKENREKSTIKHPNVGSGARNEGWEIYPGTIKAGPLPSWNSSSSALRERLSLAEARSSLGSGLASLPREKNSRISGMRALPEIPSLEHGQHRAEESISDSRLEFWLPVPENRWESLGDGLGSSLSGKVPAPSLPLSVTTSEGKKQKKR